MGCCLNDDVIVSVDKADESAFKSFEYPEQVFVFARMRSDIKNLAYVVIAPNRETAVNFFANLRGTAQHLETFGNVGQALQGAIQEEQKLKSHDFALDPTPPPIEFRSCCTCSRHVPVLLVGHHSKEKPTQTVAILDKWVRADIGQASAPGACRPILGIRVSDSPVAPCSEKDPPVPVGPGT
jgi:hypothetical protein